MCAGSADLGGGEGEKMRQIPRKENEQRGRSDLSLFSLLLLLSHPSFPDLPPIRACPYCGMLIPPIQHRCPTSLYLLRSTTDAPLKLCPTCHFPSLQGKHCVPQARFHAPALYR